MKTKQLSYKRFQTFWIPVMGYYLVQQINQIVDTFSHFNSIVPNGDLNLLEAKRLLREVIFLRIFATTCSFSIFVAVIYSRITKIENIDLKAINLSQTIFSEETVEYCFKPLVADWKKERTEKVKEGKRLKADLITIRYAGAFFVAMIKQTRIGKLFEILFK